MSRLFKRSKFRKPTAEKYCFQANNDEMLFFPTRERLEAYYRDYSRRFPLHKLCIFKVEFYELENYDSLK